MAKLSKFKLFVSCPNSFLSPIDVEDWRSSRQARGERPAFVIMIGESIGGEQCSNLAHLPFSKKSRGEKGRVCGFTVRTVLQAEKSIGWMRRVVVVVAEKGWEVSPPPDGSPLLANWQNHPAGTGEAICMMDQSRKRHSHTLECIRRVAGKKAKSKMICFQLLPSIILTEVQGSGGRIQEVEMSPLQLWETPGHSRDVREVGESVLSGRRGVLGLFRKN